MREYGNATTSADRPTGSGEGIPGKVTRTSHLPARAAAHASAVLGQDVSDVSFHHSGEPEALGTRAFARGGEVHLARGAHLGDGDGSALIGHELTHVAQQRAGRVPATGQRDGRAVNTDPALEAEADQRGTEVLQGFDLDGFLDFGLPASRAGASVLQGEALPAEATAPTPTASCVVKEGQTPRAIADEHGVALERLLDANRDKVKTWVIDGRTIEGFNAGDVLVIPAATTPGAAAPSPAPSVGAAPAPGASPSAPTGDGNAPAEQGTQTWSEWATQKARSVADTVATTVGSLVDQVLGAIGEALTGAPDSAPTEEPSAGAPAPATPAPAPAQPAPPTATPAPGAGSPPAATSLPAERMTHWVDLAASCYADKKAAGKMSTAYNVEQIDGWLAELATDQAATTDPVQLRVLAGVQFQFETTKRGTDYDLGSARDLDLEGTFDCSEAVQWMMTRAGLGEIFGETTGQIATVYMFGIIEAVFGSALRAQPRTGDIMMWGGHTGVVADVREPDRLFYVSHIGGSGSYFTPFDLDDPNVVDSKRGINIGAKSWSGGVKGYWAPEDAALPAPVGTATTVVAKGSQPKKFFKPSTDAYAEGAFAPGLPVELLKQTGDLWLVRPVGSQGAAWVRSMNLELDAPAAAPDAAPPAAGAATSAE